MNYVYIHYRGQSIGSGHYYTDNYDAALKKFTRYDDSTVKDVPLNVAMGQETAYVIIYRINESSEL